MEFPGVSGQRVASGEQREGADVHARKCRASPIGVCVHQSPSTPVQRAEHVSRARRGPERLLRMAPAADLESCTRGCAAASPDPRRVHCESGIYGAPRVFLDLREAGETCSKHRVARLMRINGIRAAYGYGARRHSAAKPSALIPNSLQRNFTVSKPNSAWVDVAGLALSCGGHGSLLPKD